MKTSTTLIRLSWLIAVLALLATVGGLLWPTGGAPAEFTTLRGETAQIFGRGLYRYDTLFKGAANQATDVVSLVLGIPLLAFCTFYYRRGSRRGGLLLLGTLVYFLYVYASYGLGIAYNRLFLVYIALFSASFWAFTLAFGSVDGQIFSEQAGGPASAGLLRRSLAIFMFASGLVTLVVWLGPLLDALVRNVPPGLLGPYTTNITDVLDLGIITPAAFIAGMLILRRNPLGYQMALSLLVLEIMLAPMIAAQTVSQLRAGISFTIVEIVGPIMGFVVLALFAVWMLVALLRNISDVEEAT